MAGGMSDRQILPSAGATHGATVAPSLADIDALAQAAVETLPRQFRDWLSDVLLRVEDFPDAEVMAAMALETEFDIRGLYWGRHVGTKGDVPTGALPDIIFLYRRPLLEEWCETGETLEALVTHVLVHEVGHHFGAERRRYGAYRGSGGGLDAELGQHLLRRRFRQQFARFVTELGADMDQLAALGDDAGLDVDWLALAELEERDGQVRCPEQVIARDSRHRRERQHLVSERGQQSAEKGPIAVELAVVGLEPLACPAFAPCVERAKTHGLDHRRRLGPGDQGIEPRRGPCRHRVRLTPPPAPPAAAARQCS